jgi:type IV secretory pathway VirJ component
MEMKLVSCFFMMLLAGMVFCNPVDGQNNLPVIVTPSANTTSQKPMVLMITGDGGWKSTDKQLSDEFAANGIPVVALNALKYFWTKKTPEQTTQTIEGLLNRYMTEWHKTDFILAGFSFGADVMPFIINRLPPELLSKNQLVVLLSPGPSTDFEIHISQMLSSGHQWKYNVVKEIQQIKDQKMLFFFGDDETEFPMDSIPKNNCSVVLLNGGHHYEDNKANIADLILQHL